MSSRTERGAIAVWLLLAGLGCPDASTPILVEPPPAAADSGIQAPSLPPGLPPPTRVETLDAIVFEFGGKAEVRRGGAGDWVDLAIGDAVRVEDEVRTSGDGHLEMRFGEARIEVHEGSELTLRFLDARAIRAEVRGLASGDAADGGQLTFEGKGTGVVAVGNGQLSLDSNDRRSVASSLSGGTTLTSGGTTVELQPGQLAMVQGAALTKVPIPKKVSLKVGWPAQIETNQQALTVKGSVSAYSRVLVAGRRVEAAADGTFQTQVILKEGSQKISVVAIDPLGRRATEKRQITFDPNAPSVRGKVEYR